MNAEPVFFSYPHVSEIDSLVDSVKSASDPEYDITTDDGIQHTLWVISSDDDILKIENYFSSKGAINLCCRWPS